MFSPDGRSSNLFVQQSKPSNFMNTTSKVLNRGLISADSKGELARNHFQHESVLSSITSIAANSMNNNDHTGATNRHKNSHQNGIGMPDNKNKNVCPMSTGRKA